MLDPGNVPICASCGSNELLFDAYAEWDSNLQEFILQNTFDSADCNNCGLRDTDIHWIRDSFT